jgi:CRP-like cAMP-binding protein
MRGTPDNWARLVTGNSRTLSAPWSKFKSMVEWLSQTLQAAGTERALEAGQVLFRTGQRTAGLYKVMMGGVRLVRTDRAGREAVLHVAMAGETLAEASLFASAYHCDAIATTKAVVRLYPKAAVLAEFERDPKVAREFIAMLAHQVMKLRTRLEQRNIHSARDRVQHYLALNAGADGRTVVVRGTLKDIADEIGLTHEALYRTLADMATAGEIERRKGKIVLV